MEGWETKSLGEACDLYQPKTIAKKELIEDGPYVVFGANGPIGHYHSFNHEDPQVVVTCRGATCGSVSTTPRNTWITGNAMVIAPKEDCLDLRFLHYLMLHTDFSSVISGAAQPQITRTSLSPLEIKYPKSLPEQERIVAILDEAFAAIETATAHTEKNLANARELFESQLQALLNPGDAVMEEWENTKLEEILEVQSGFAFRSKDYSEDGHFLIRIGNVQDREISLNKPKFVRLDKSTQRFELNAGDWLTSLTGNIGRVAIIKKSHLPAALNQRVARLSLIKNNPVHEGFVFYFLTSDHFKSELCDSGHGTAQKNVSPKAIGNIALLLPPLPEQERIVDNLDAASEKSQQLCDAYDLKLEHLSHLKQSLLQKAFTGELTSDKKAADRTLSEAGL